MTLHDELAGRLEAAAALLTRTGNGDLAVSVLNAADEVKRLREHISEQITHVETRIQDGTTMGARVWRIALEDIVRENRAALNQGPTQ